MATLDDDTNPTLRANSVNSSVDAVNPKSNDNAWEKDNTQYPPLPKVIVIMLSLYLAIFLVALVS
jgi:hypothetical protein